MAFIAPLLWLMFYRCWLAVTAVVIAVIGFLVLARFLLLGADSVLLVLISASVLIGLEANAIRSWSLRRRGFRLVDAVVARHQSEAETMLVARWLANAMPEELAIHAVGLSHERQSADGVVGLFPEPEVGR